MNKRILGYILLILAVGLGLFTGWVDSAPIHQTATLLSDLFLRLLKLVSLPIIFLAVASTITGMRDFSEMRKLGRKVLTYTLATTIVAASIALGLFVLLKPATGWVEVAASNTAVSAEQPSYFSFILDIIPSNIFSAFAEGNVMGIVFAALLFSIAILLLPSEQKELLHRIFSGLFAALIKVTGFVISFMPLAIWAFVDLLFQDLKIHNSKFHSLLLYLICVFGANLIQGLIALPLFLKWKKISPLKSFKGSLPALTVAFFTKSSNAALPVTIRSAEQNLGISNRVANFTLPLCSVINMNGCAAFILTTVLFVSTLHGIIFSPLDMIGWVVIATLAAVGNAGVPMGCFFLTSAFLIGMDVPLLTMGLILPFYAILDMVETALNVWSDLCVTAVVDKELQEVPLSCPKEIA